MEKLICYVDGGCDNSSHSNAYGSFRIYDENEEEERAHIKFNLKYLKTSNEAEYGSLITLLMFLNQNYQDHEYEIYTDSKLMFSQLTGGWRVLAGNLKPLYTRAKASLKEIKNYRLYWVPREEIVKRLGH